MRRYGVEFAFDGKRWEVEIWADDRQQAEAKLNALKMTGFVYGEDVEEIEVTPAQAREIVIRDRLRRFWRWFTGC